MLNRAVRLAWRVCRVDQVRGAAVAALEAIRWARANHATRRRWRRAQRQADRRMRTAWRRYAFARQALATWEIASVAALGVFNVVSYGADPTGANDSIPAVNAAVAAAGSTGGLIDFPAGVFTFASALSPQPAGSGPLVYRGRGPATVIKAASSSTVNLVANPANNSANSSNLSFEDLTFDLNVSGRASSLTNLNLRGDKIRIRRCQFQGGVDFVNNKYFNCVAFVSANTTNRRSTDIEVSDCEFVGVGDALVLQGVDDFRLINNTFTGGSSNGIDINSSHGGVIVGNMAYLNGGPSASGQEGNGILLFSKLSNGGILDIAVTGNTCRSNGQMQFGATIGTSRDGIRISDDGTVVNTGVVCVGNRCYDDFATAFAGDTLAANITTAPAQGTIETWTIPGLPNMWPLAGAFSFTIDTETMTLVSGWRTNQWTVIRGQNGTATATHNATAAITPVQMQAYGVRVTVSFAGARVEVAQNDVTGNRTGGVFLPAAGAINAGIVARGNVGFNPVGSGIAAPAFPATTVGAQNLTGVDVYAYVTNGVNAMTVQIDGLAAAVVIPASAVCPVFLPAGSTFTPTYAGGAPSWKWYGL